MDSLQTFCISVGKVSPVCVGEVSDLLSGHVYLPVSFRQCFWAAFLLFFLFLCLCSDCYLSSVHSIPSESWKITLANNPLCAGAPASLFWVHHTHGYSCCAATACIMLLTQKPGEGWLDAITVFCTYIVILLLEWLLFKIFKVLLSFSVWANKEVSCRTSSAKLLKNASRKYPKYYIPE